MFNKIQKFQGQNPNVWKYVFENREICVEAVLYKYDSFEKRTVMCVSVQSGCPIGCTFCGTGRNFIRNLTQEEIEYQVDYIVHKIELEAWDNKVSLNSRCEKLQIMFMSMGEPMLNWDNVEAAIHSLNNKYRNAQLLVSTMGVKDEAVFKRICSTSAIISKVGLQFSIHEPFDHRRDELIPFANKLTLRELRDAGMLWNKHTGRPVFLNFCITDIFLGIIGESRIYDLFSPMVFNLTFSVVCTSDGTEKNGIIKEKEYEIIYKSMQNALNLGYNVRQFDPAGQDDIGAGCGQLWYVQEWMKNRGEGCK